MGFYIRKAVKAGPFRFNLSKSGIGVSTGIRGLRFGSGPRGNYVHMGRGGLYFRRSLDPAGTARLPRPTQPSREPPNSSAGTVGPMQEIESGSVLDMTDSSADELISEINSKLRKMKLLPFVLGATGATTVGLAANAAPGWAFVLTWVIGAAVSVWAYFRDDLRTSVVVMYDFDRAMEEAYSNIHAAFDEIMQCAAIWHIPTAGDVLDRKYHAGASRVVTRRRIKPAMGQPKPLKTNIQVPVLEAGKQRLAFMPERLLVFESRSVGAVPYSSLTIEVDSSGFVEEERVPKDSDIVDHTWRYVNKKGGPDRRFKDNPRLPIALYEDIHLVSKSGLNEQFKASKVGTGSRLRDAITRAGNLLSSVNDPNDLKAG